MKTVDQLQEFYEGQLSAGLGQLEKKRQHVFRTLYLSGGIVGLIVAIVLVLMISAGMGPAFVIPIVIGALIFAGIIWLTTKDYKRQFKDEVIRPLVAFLDEGLKYYPSDKLSKAVFMQSEIFKTRPNRYKGDDLVRGRIGDTDVEFCELNAQYESGSGKNRTVRTVFRGLFFVADFNKYFRGRTIVLPDTAEKVFGGFGKMLQGWNISRPQLIKLEDVEFEKLFVVYGDDQVEARYILSTSLMERIVGFRNKTGNKIYLSFVGSKVFVAVPFTRNLFEPRIMRTLLDFEMVREYFEDLQLAVGIVYDLNLNTRIWSKE